MRSNLAHWSSFDSWPDTHAVMRLSPRRNRQRLAGARVARWIRALVMSPTTDIGCLIVAAQVVEIAGGDRSIAAPRSSTSGRFSFGSAMPRCSTLRSRRRGT